jgi:hypothetical protein
MILLLSRPRRLWRHESLRRLVARWLPSWIPQRGAGRWRLWFAHHSSGERGGDHRGFVSLPTKWAAMPQGSDQPIVGGLTDHAPPTCARLTPVSAEGGHFWLSCLIEATKCRRVRIILQIRNRYWFLIINGKVPMPGKASSSRAYL